MTKKWNEKSRETVENQQARMPEGCADRGKTCGKHEEKVIGNATSRMQSFFLFFLVHRFKT